jgi:hypothetical protein
LPTSAQLIRDGVILMCEKLKPEAVALVDVISPTDFVLNSALGHSNGKVVVFYKTLNYFPNHDSLVRSIKIFKQQFCKDQK